MRLNQNLRFTSPEQSTRFAQNLAPLLNPGDTILLRGGLGAGKTHFARGIIQARLAAIGLAEDVPSPTFTLVQTYDIEETEIWHADLYRISGPDEIFELGLDEAIETAICLIEWPDRLHDLSPMGALSLTFQMTDTPGERIATAQWDNSRWSEILNTATQDV